MLRDGVNGLEYPAHMRKIAEERYGELKSSGRTEISQSMAFFLFTAAGAVLFGVLGVWMMRDVAGPGEPWFRALGHFYGWIALAAILFCLIGAIAIAVQARQHASLVITRDGIEEHRTRGGERVVTFDFPWQQIESVSARHYGGRWPYKGQYVVQLTLDPVEYRNYRRELTPVKQRLEAASARMSAPHTISLQRYSGGPKALHELLDRAHREFCGASRRT